MSEIKNVGLKPSGNVATFSKLLNNSYKGDKKLSEIDVKIG